MRLTLKDAHSRWVRGRLHDEAMIARELQASGMNRNDALRAAADHVRRMYLLGQEPGSIANIKRMPGNNGGPLLDGKWH